MDKRRRHVLTGALLAACVVSISPAAAAATEPVTPSSDPPPPASPSPAPIADRPIVVWPALTPAGDDVGPTAVHKPSPTEGAVYLRAQELDATLRDAVQDLGYALDVADPGPAMGRARDLDMIERASRATTHGSSATDSGTWVVSARLEPVGGDNFILRIVAVPPKGKQLRVRTERVSGPDVAVRGLVLLRDLLTTAPPPSTDPGARPTESATTGIMSPIRSQGRAVLAVNAALFGAYAAFSIQRASGSEDPRLLYPLLTLGTGVGLGGALLVAEEWDVGTGDAWTLAAGAWWGAGAGVLIANGRHVQPLTDRYAWGVGGGLVGLGLATFSVARGKADEGDAVLAHSGAALGLGLGALGDFFYRGDLEQATPYTGAGYGAAVGLVTGGAIAMFTKVDPSRVLLVDLGAGLGAAAGAAAASPLLFEDVTPAKTRGFVAATAVGTLAGGFTAWLLTREKRVPQATSLRLVPFGGVVGASPETREPAYGAGVRGVF